MDTLQNEHAACGERFPDGLVKNPRLERNVITPTTKAEVDELITPKEIVERGS